VRAAPQTPSRFTLRVPSSWFQFDIWRATRSGELTRIVDDHLTRLPNLRPHRRDILKALRGLAEEAERAGAVTCAAAVEEEGAVLATLAVFVTEGMSEPALNTVPAIAAQIPATSRPDPDSDGVGESDWREVRVIDLPAGEAVQVRSVSTLEGQASSAAVRIVSMETLVPMPGRERVLNVVLTSPQTRLADDLLDLFGLITETLAWVGTPTPA
jgi:hypothetical protein